MKTAEISLKKNDNEKFNVKLKDDGITIKDIDATPEMLKDFMERKIGEDELPFVRKAVKLLKSNNIKLKNL